MMRIDEDFDCFPAVDGIVHPPHEFTPYDDDEAKVMCEGVSNPLRKAGSVEQRTERGYRLAMWVTYYGIKTLHKGKDITKDLEEVKQWKQEYEEDFSPGVWFIIFDDIETRSYLV